MNDYLEQSRSLLKKFFGYDDFRVGQFDIISHILNHEDCLAVMPTGSGKSICYQIPSLILDGCCIVVSPLISLMKDQVDGLNEIGISSAFINSSLSSREYIKTVQNAAKGMYKIIYVAPERLDSDSFFELMSNLNISMFAIDEAHCVSRWGHDFRPSYTNISNVISRLSYRPVVAAFTATATEMVKKDIVSLLNLSNPFCLTTGFDRKNLSFSVETPTNRKKFIYSYVQSHLDDSGIVYCLTRKSVDDLYDNLLRLGVRASKYHAGMSDKDRSINQNDFVYDKTSVMVATNAFGMGIDKSNIRYVIHMNMPRDLESYYQEAGRAGRDGDVSSCILLFHRSDIMTNKFLIEQGSPYVDHSNEYKKLNDIVDYCNTDKCLRRYILEYFGESPVFDLCNNCSNCNSEIELTDITEDSKKILSCIKRMNERYGVGLVADVLKGSRSSKVIGFGFDKLSTYGIMSEYSKSTIKELISFLVSEGYIKNVGDKYPVLVLKPESNDVLFGGKQVFIKRKFEKSDSVVDSTFAKPVDMVLFDILKSLRVEVADKSGVPPFIVFTDVSLKYMASEYPVTVDDFLNIPGVGRFKMERYGYVFLDAICKYVKDNNIVVDSSSCSQRNSVNKKSSDLEKESTRKISFDLYKSGKSILEIANIRGLTKQTIQNHLLDCYKNGFDLDLEKEIHTEYKDVICDAINTFGTDKLKPLKDAVPNAVSYLDIRYYIYELEKNNK